MCLYYFIVSEHSKKSMKEIAGEEAINENLEQKRKKICCFITFPTENPLMTFKKKQ